MPSFSLDLSGEDDVKDAIEDFGDEVEDALKEEIDSTSVKIWNQTRDNAPEQSGDLVDSYRRKVGVNELDAKIFSRLEYSRRIELGFFGEDELGREYSQQGQFPLTRAFDEEVKGFEQRVENRM